MWRMPYTIAVNIFRVPGIISTMRKKIKHPEDSSEEDAYAYVKYIVGLMQRTGRIRTEGYGMENLPKEGGYMLFPNHQGKYDAYGIVAVHDKPCTVVMDDAKSHYLLVTEIIDMLKGKRMVLNDPRQSLKIINEITQEVAQGRRYILFPEGGYVNGRGNAMGDFKAGCFRTALRSKTPIVPVAIIDSWKPYNSWQFSPVTTQVHFLEPIPYEEYRALNTTQIAQLVRGRIQQKLDEVALAAV